MKLSALTTLLCFDLFLRGALFILILFDGYIYLLLRRSAMAGFLHIDIEDWAFMGASAGDILFGSLLAWLGRNRRPLALSTCFGILGTIGLIVLAFEQPAVVMPSVEICDGVIATNEVQTFNAAADGWRSAILIISSVLCGLTRISILSHGVTYTDDHLPKRGPFIYGLLVSISVSVGFNSRNWFASHSRSEDWWKGQVSLSILLLGFSALFALFPNKMPDWKEPEDGNLDTGYLATVSRIVTNKAVVLQTIALSFLMTAIWGFAFYASFFVRAQYNFVDTSTWSDGKVSALAGTFFRTFMIVYFVMIFRARFSGFREDGVKATTASKVGGFVALVAGIFFFTLIAVTCNKGEIQGMGGEYEQPECSMQCGCDSSSSSYGFAPVCVLHSSTTYFSPCHAGCSSSEDLQNFVLLDNCTCGSGGRAVPGDCSRDVCQTTYAIYQILYVNALAFSAASLLMQGMVILRAVRPTDLGLVMGVVAFIAHVPGNFIYRAISDATCAYEVGGRCHLHRDSLGPALAGVSGALMVLSAVASILAFKARRSDSTGTNAGTIVFDK